MSKTIYKYKTWMVLIFVLAALEIFFFRNIMLTTSAFGDYGDGRYCNLAAEHWYQFVTGNEGIGELSIFYPAINSLGYSDTFLGFSLPYIVIRFLGNDMFAAFKASIVVIHFFGVVCTLYFCMKKLKLNYCASLISTIIFAYANMQNTATHPQFYALYYIPLFSIFIWNYFENINNKNKRMVYAISAISVFAVIFYTTGYIGYFIAIFILFAFVITSITLYIGDKRNNCEIKRLKLCISYIKENYIEYISFMVYAILIFIPFIILYLPIQQKNTSVRHWSDIMCPTLVDFINVAPSNLLWGKVLQFGEGHYAEFQTGFPLITIGIFILGLVYLTRMAYGKIKRNECDYKLLLNVIFSISTICCFILILKINKYSLWYLVFKFVPGASTIRAVTRFNQVLVWPVSLVIGYIIHTLKINYMKYIRFGLLILFVLEYTWVGGITSMWNTDEPRNMLSKVSAPPSDCKVMYIVNDDIASDEHDYARAHLDAWMIAYKYKIRTINGYGSYYPQGWEKVNYIRGSQYESAAYNWGIQNNIEGFYSYDLKNDKWQKASSMPEYNYDLKSCATQNSEYSGDKLILKEHGVLYGPYLNLNEGTYKVEIKGENLNNIEYYSCCNIGENNIDINNIDSSANNIIYTIKINNNLNDVEFPIKNLGVDNVYISSLKVCKIEE